MAISATLAALLLSFIPSSQAAPTVVKVVKPSILSVEVVGEAVTIKWSSPKLPAKAFFEVELTRKTATPSVSVIRAVGYRIRVRESLTTNTGSSSVYTLTSPNLNPST
jgi:hypothetical protein